MQTVNHCKRPCDWLTLPSIKTLLARHWLAYNSQNWGAVIGTSLNQSVTPGLFWVITSPVIEGERRGRAHFARNRPFYRKQKLEYELESIFLWKWTLSTTITRIAHVNKGGSFVFSPIFSLFWIKKWDASWRVDPYLEMCAGVSWNSPSRPEL